MRKIPLTKGKHALVSDEDYERLSKHKWCASLESRGTKWYAIRWERKDGKPKKVRMHRLVAGWMGPLKPGKVVDHLNHNSLDNRRENLEVTDQAENMHRSPGWKGSRSWRERDMAMRKKAGRPKKKPIIEHNLGDRHEVDGTLCEIKFLNAGKGWLFPVIDDPEDTMIARHICLGKINEHGEVTLL